MRTAFRIVLMVGLWSATLQAADPPKVDPTPVITIKDAKPVTAEVGKKCILTVDTSAKKVTWRTPDGVDSIALDGKRLAVWALPGVYTLTAMVPSGDDVVSVDVVLTVTGSVVTPPINVGLKALQDAYDAEPATVTTADGTTATKADDKVKLIAVYRASAAGLGDLKTNTDVFTAIKKTTEARIDGRLTKVRGVVNAEFAKFMPKAGNTVLTDAEKIQASATLTTFAKLLEEGVK